MFAMCPGKKILPLQSKRQLCLLETFATEKVNGTPSVADLYFHFDADPDPVSDLHHNVADPHADPTPYFTHVGKQSQKNYPYSQQCQFTMFFFLISGGTNSNLNLPDPPK
jgi:hypothetical protein